MRRAALLLVTMACLPAAPVAGQTAPLRIEGPAGVVEVAGSAAGAPSYAATAAVEALGGSVLPWPGGVRLLLFGDTLTFQATSPFFRTGADVHHLAYPALRDGAGLRLPEQFFIAWLPAAYPGHVAYRGGTLRVADAAPEVVPAARSEAPPTATRPAPASPAAPAAARPGAPGTADARVVVLDAGHGGRDPGKIGPGRLQEKQVTLALTERLARVLRDRGYEVHLTRDADTLIDLGDRPHMANEVKGARPRGVFVSIHANAWTTAQPRGFETYFLAEATTEDERRVAEMENAALAYEQGSGAGASTRDAILSSLRNEYWVRASATLAATVQRRLAAFHPGPNRGVKRAEFVVLIGAVMPAVLVETGFISNPDEARLLASAAFQDKVTWGLADALDEFFAGQEPLWAAGR